MTDEAMLLTGLVGVGKFAHAIAWENSAKVMSEEEGVTREALTAPVRAAR